MATIQLKSRPASAPGRRPSLYIRIIHRREVKTISCHLDDTPDHRRSPRVISLLRACRRAAETLDRLPAPYTAADIRARALAPALSITDFVEQEIQTLTQLRRHGTARSYTTLLRNLRRCLGADTWPLADTDRRRIADFADRLRRRHITRNTLSSYLRPLRALLRKADRLGLVRYEDTWFDGLYLGVDATQKRAATPDDLRRLQRLDLAASPALAFARDIFLFSFYCCGMAFVDIVHLTPADIEPDRIVYRRQKTGQLLHIPLCAEARAIIRRHGREDEPRLFPLLADDTRRCYDSALRVHNDRLRRIGRMAGCTAPISSYTPRHSWATRAQALGVPLSHISACMGHTSERTTRIYLAGLGAPDLAATAARVSHL